MNNHHGPFVRLENWRISILDQVHRIFIVKTRADASPEIHHRAMCLTIPVIGVRENTELAIVIMKRTVHVLHFNANGDCVFSAPSSIVLFRRINADNGVIAEIDSLRKLHAVLESEQRFAEHILPTFLPIWANQSVHAETRRVPCLPKTPPVYQSPTDFARGKMKKNSPPFLRAISVIKRYLITTILAQPAALAVARFRSTAPAHRQTVRLHYHFPAVPLRL